MGQHLISEIENSNNGLRPLLKQSALDLLAYCRERDWSGWDPYDGLNSPLFTTTPLLQNYFCRLAFIQFCKRSPINFRPLFRVPKQQNPKGLALFSTALLSFARQGLAEGEEARQLFLQLIEARSKGMEFSCWGYNFPWQTRSYLVPRFTPNIICTTFAANALLDGYEAFAETDCLC